MRIVDEFSFCIEEIDKLTQSVPNRWCQSYMKFYVHFYCGAWRKMLRNQYLRKRKSFYIHQWHKSRRTSMTILCRRHSMSILRRRVKTLVCFNLSHLQVSNFVHLFTNISLDIQTQSLSYEHVKFHLSPQWLFFWSNILCWHFWNKWPYVFPHLVD